MLQQLKFDFYKIRKSNTLKAIFWITIALCFMVSLTQYTVTFRGTKASLLSSMRSESICDICVVLFVSVFIGKDFSQGYIKNIFSSINKKKYFISKLFFSFAYVFSIYLLNFIINMLFHFILANQIFYDIGKDNFTVWSFVINKLLYLAILCAISSMLIFLTMIFKKYFVVLIIYILYLLLFSSMLYSTINSIVGNGFVIQYYTVLGNLQYIATLFGKTNETIGAFICMLIYIVFTNLGGYWLFKRSSF